MKSTSDIKRISIVGSGNLAWHLAKALRASDLDVLHVISRNRETGQELADAVNSSFLSHEEEPAILPEVFFICVQDKEIASVIRSLQKYHTPLLHVSGSTGMEVFEELKVPCGVFYPLQSFSRQRSLDFSDIPILLEATDHEFLHVMKNLAKALSTSVLELNSEQRRQLHLAAVFASNFMNHIQAIANDLCSDKDIDSEIMKPLVTETLHKMMEKGAKEAQTGPALRKDVETVQRHIKMLQNKPQEQEIYQLLSKSIQDYHE